MATFHRRIGAALACASMALTATANAVTLTGLEGFDAGHLIADSTMDADHTMTAADVQDFLAIQGSSCVLGTDGSPCLKDATFTTPDRPATEFCDSYEGTTGEPASAIIATTAAVCGINPQVLLVMLQKEQGLVTTTNPTATAYERAMGFRCPDGLGCEPEYAGFPSQVYFAASRLNEYRLYPERFSYHVGGTYDVRYHPDPACGTTSITMRTAATAALYNYTPYTPNEASLAAVTGLGDSCSSYGNRNFFRLFSLWFGTPNVTPLPPTIARWDGLDRYEVSANISSVNFPAGADTVYVANGLASADALAAGPVAGMEEGPILLVKKDGIPTAVATELGRLNPTTVVVLGGEGSVSATVEDKLATYAADVIRWDGADRYVVSANISKVNFPAGADTVYVANGLASADALAAGPVAGMEGGPILLVKKDGIPTSVATELKRLNPTTVVVLGGEGSVSATVETKLATYADTVVRWDGADRYVVSANISNTNFPSGAGTVFVANGLASADALAAGPVAAMIEGPILLVKKDGIPTSVAEEIERITPARIVILGGTGSVSDGILGSG